MWKRCNAALLLGALACGSSPAPCLLAGEPLTSTYLLAPLADAGLLDPSWTCAQTCFVAEQLPTSDGCMFLDGGGCDTCGAQEEVLCGDGTAIGADWLADAGWLSLAPRSCLAVCQHVYLADTLAFFAAVDGSSDPYTSCELTDGGDALVSCTSHPAAFCPLSDGGNP